MFAERENVWLKKGNTYEGIQGLNPALWNSLKEDDVDVFSVN